MAAVTIFTITYIDLAGRRRQTGIQRAIGIRSGPIVGSYILKAWAGVHAPVSWRAQWLHRNCVTV